MKPNITRWTFQAGPGANATAFSLKPGGGFQIGWTMAGFLGSPGRVTSCTLSVFLFTCSVWRACCHGLAPLQRALWVLRRRACALLMQVRVSVYAADWLTAVAVWPERCLLISLWAFQVEKSVKATLRRGDKKSFLVYSFFFFFLVHVS